MIAQWVVVVLALGAAPDPDEFRTEVRPSPRTSAPSQVLGPERLDAVPDLATALDGEVGLRLTRLGGLGSYTTVSIRGSTPEQVLVVLDGIPLDVADGAPVDISTLPLGPLESVALYRGRAPFVFGSDAIGGVLSLSSRSSRRAGAAVDVGLGSLDTRSARAWGALAASSAANIALAVDYLGGAGDFRFENDMGTAFDPNDDVQVRRQNAAFDQGSVLVKGLFDLGAVTLTCLDLFTLVERGLPGLGVHPTRRSHFRLLRNLGSVRADARAGKVRIGALGFLGWSTTTVEDPDGEIGLGVGSSEVASLVPGAIVDVSAPLRIGDAWRLSPALVAAGRFEHTRGTGRVDAARGVMSVAAEAELRHRGGFGLGGGVRLLVVPELAPSARLATSMSVSDRLRVAASGNLSYRLPSLFELHGDTGTTLGSPELRPEKGRGFELEARWEPWLDTAFEVFAFATWHDDLIQVVQNAQGVARPENVASARFLGLELSAESLVLDGYLLVRAGLTYLDARDTSDLAARRGRALPARPPLQVSGHIEGRFDELTLWVELDVTSANALDFANLVTVPARALLSAGVAIRAGGWRVDATLTNLLDERVQDLAGYPLPGVTALVRAGWSKF